MPAKRVMTAYAKAEAARVADAVYDATVPPALTAAVTAAGFGQHDKWPASVVRGALRLLADNPDTDATALTGELSSRAGDTHAALAEWLVQVGDPAWAVIDGLPKNKPVAETIKAARDQMATTLVASTVEAITAAAIAAADHVVDTKTVYEQEDQEVASALGDEADQVKAEAARLITARRAATRVQAMWGVNTRGPVGDAQ